jgi:aminoglycoside phosphotransferase (APT) family kinase protein
VAHVPRICQHDQMVWHDRAVTTLTAASQEQLRLLLRAARPDWRFIQAWKLPGSTGAQVSAIEAEEPSGRHRTLVLHQYGPANLQADPDIATHEYRLLGLLASAGLPVPRPYLADASCSIVASPCLLQDFVDGEPIDDPPDLAAFTAELATTLAALHAAAIDRADVPFLADVLDDTTRMMGTRSARGSAFRWATAVLGALKAAWPPQQLNRSAVLHGDYWPGNVLWCEGRLVGVVDWEDALFGDPLADLAVTRLEVAGLHGTAAMNLLTRQYLALRPELDVSMLPLWDLRAAMRASGFQIETWGLPARRLAAVRAAYGEFAASALRQTGCAAAKDPAR